jgi:small subunit ribosomal protein S16
MVKIRLLQVGAKNNLIFRIVAIEESRAREGKALDVIGYWYPKKDKAEIDKKKLGYWVDHGAQVTHAVEKIMAK